MAEFGTFLPFTGGVAKGGSYLMPTFSDWTFDLMGRPNLAVRALAGSGRAALLTFVHRAVVFGETHNRSFREFQPSLTPDVRFISTFSPSNHFAPLSG